MSLHPHPGSGQHLSSVSSSRFPSFSAPIQFASIHGAVHGMSNIPLEHSLAFPISETTSDGLRDAPRRRFSRVVLCRSTFQRRHVPFDELSTCCFACRCASLRALQGGGSDTNDTTSPFPTDFESSEKHPPSPS